MYKHSELICDTAETKTQFQQGNNISIWLSKVVLYN